MKIRTLLRIAAHLVIIVAAGQSSAIASPPDDIRVLTDRDLSSLKGMAILQGYYPSAGTGSLCVSGLALVDCIGSGSPTQEWNGEKCAENSILWSAYDTPPSNHDECLPGECEQICILVTEPCATFLSGNCVTTFHPSDYWNSFRAAHYTCDKIGDSIRNIGTRNKAY
jgi:hypothetical protein